MAYKHITQREARRLQKRVEELESQEIDRRTAWSQDWPGGCMIVIQEYPKNDAAPVAIRTARALKHAVVATADSDGKVRFFALPVAK